MVRDDGTVARPLALFRVEGDQLSFESYVESTGAPWLPQGANPATPGRLAPR